jgi:hypothetical protein
MSLDRNDVFSRVRGRVTDLREIESRLVIFCGAGSVGSIVAAKFAKIGVRRMVIADGDRFEPHNLVRHHLTSAYINLNKAEAMADTLTRDIPGMEVGAVPTHLDEQFSDLEIDQLLAPADLIVVATDSRDSQRRLAARAFALDIPCLVPALYPNRAGEVFVQLTNSQPCFQCWDLFRGDTEDVRGVSSIEADADAVIQQTVWLAEGLLDPRSPNIAELSPAADDPLSRLRQIFIIQPGAAIQRASVAPRDDCPGCAVGPSPVGPDAPDPGGPAGIVRQLTAEHRRVDAAGWPLVLTGEVAPPEIRKLAVERSVVVEGELATVRWETSNATGVELDGVRHPHTGSARISVDRTRALSFTAINPFGDTEAEPLVVRAIEVPKITRIPVFTLGTPLSQIFGGTDARSTDFGPPPRHAGEAPLVRPSLSAALGRRPSISDTFRGPRPSGARQSIPLADTADRG